MRVVLWGVLCGLGAFVPCHAQLTTLPDCAVRIQFFNFFFDQLESKIADLSLGSLYVPSLLCKARGAL